MTTRRDRMLQEMGITQWTLRRPSALRGEVALSLPEMLRVLAITNQPFSFREPVLLDIMAALQLSESQFYCIAPEQVLMLPQSVDCACWCLGTEVELPGAEIKLYSPPLSELLQDARAKRTFWQQICHHEHYFFIDPD